MIKRHFGVIYRCHMRYIIHGKCFCSVWYQTWKHDIWSPWEINRKWLISVGFHWRSASRQIEDHKDGQIINTSGDKWCDVWSEKSHLVLSFYRTDVCLDLFLLKLGRECYPRWRRGLWIFRHQRLHCQSSFFASRVVGSNESERLFHQCICQTTYWWTIICATSIPDAGQSSSRGRNGLTRPG